MQKISQLLDEVVTINGIAEAIGESKVYEIWVEAVGEVIGDRAKLLNVEKGTIFIEVNSASWRQEIDAHKSRIIERINELLGSKIIKDMVLR